MVPASAPLKNGRAALAGAEAPKGMTQCWQGRRSLTRRRGAIAPRGRAAANSLKAEVVALKKERITEAAADLIYERGYENTTLDAVAEYLGVTKPFIYSYFKSKSDLLAEICSRGILASLEAINLVMADTTTVSSRDRIRLLAQRFVVAVLDTQKHVAVFSREEKNLLPQDYQRITSWRREFDKKLTAMLDAGVAKGEFAAIDTRVASLAIGGLVSWTYVWYRPHGRLTLDQVASELSELIVAMVETRQSAPQPKSIGAKARLR